MTEADAVRPVCGPGDCDRFDQIGRLGRLLTTGDIYANWDMDQLARTLADVLTDEHE